MSLASGHACVCLECGWDSNFMACMHPDRERERDICSNKSDMRKFLCICVFVVMRCVLCLSVGDRRILTLCFCYNWKRIVSLSLCFVSQDTQNKNALSYRLSRTSQTCFGTQFICFSFIREELSVFFPLFPGSTSLWWETTNLSASSLSLFSRRTVTQKDNRISGWSRCKIHTQESIYSGYSGTRIDRRHVDSVRVFFLSLSLLLFIFFCLRKNRNRTEPERKSRRGKDSDRIHAPAYRLMERERKIVRCHSMPEAKSAGCANIQHRHVKRKEKYIQNHMEWERETHMGCGWPADQKKSFATLWMLKCDRYVWHRSTQGKHTESHTHTQKSECMHETFFFEPQDSSFVCISWCTSIHPVRHPLSISQCIHSVSLLWLSNSIHWKW